MVNFMKYSYGYLATLFSVIFLDLLWLSMTMKSIYQKHLSHILAPEPTWWAAIAFYLLYAFGLYFVVIRPQEIDNKSLLNIFILGFVFGLTAYGTYDLTNQATIKDWPFFITVIDLLYGALLSGIAAMAGAWVIRK
jgi:uncharacterized membrane protein